MLLQHTKMLAQTYPLKWYTSADGLSHTTIRSLIQDVDGYLWIGTHNGLSRFDGNEFRVFTSTQSGLANKQILSLVLDSTGTGVFCNSENGGVFHIDRYGSTTRLARFDNGAISFPTNIIRIVEGEAKTLWLSTSDKKIIRYDQDGKWSYFTPSQGYDFGSCRWQVWYKPLRELWMIHGKSTIARLNLFGNESMINLFDQLPALRSISDFMILTITPNKKTGGIWVITSGGLISIEGSPPNFRFFPKETIEGHIYFAANTDAEGNVWYAASDRNQMSYSYCKASYRDGSTLLSIGRDVDFVKMLPFGTVLEDREGSVWIGSDGLAQLRNPAILNYHLRQKGFPAAARNFIQTRDGDRLIQTWMGLFRISDDIYSSPEYSIVDMGKFPRSESRIFEDVDGIIRWFDVNPRSYTYTKRRVQIDRKELRFTFRGKVFPVTETALLMNNGTLVFIPITNDRQVYFVRPDGDSSSVFLTSPIDRDTPYNELVLATRKFRNKSNVAFLNSPSSLWELHEGTVYRRYGIEDGYRGGEVSSMCEDSSGTVWLGFRRPPDTTALMRFDGNSFHVYTSPALKMPNVSIEGLCAHPNGRDMLVLTADRLYVLDLRSLRIRKTLTQRDGLFATNAGVYVDRSNIIWITSVAGLTRYDETKDNSDAKPPKVVITKFSAGEMNLRLPVAFLISNLDQRPERIEFTFSALSYRYTGLLYQTKLDGYQEAWSSPSDETFARYTNLEAGSYTFRVKALDPNGQWESREAEYVFVIPPPFYRTWWFIIGANMLAVVSILFFYRYRLAQAVKLERMRSQIAIDLHDEISSTLTSISFLSTSAEHDVRDTYPAAAQKLRKIGETARQVVEMMSDIIWSLKPEHDSFADLGKRLSDMATEMCDGTDIDLHLDLSAHEEHLPIRMDYRRHVYLIAKEAMHNAIKHSRCSEVWITLRANKGVMELTIVDNGVGLKNGIDQSGHSTHTGMSSMKKRAKEANAEIQIESNDGKGTRVRVVLREK